MLAVKIGKNNAYEIWGGVDTSNCKIIRSGSRQTIIVDEELIVSNQVLLSFNSHQFTLYFNTSFVKSYIEFGLDEFVDLDKRS